MHVVAGLQKCSEMKKTVRLARGVDMSIVSTLLQDYFRHVLKVDTLSICSTIIQVGVILQIFIIFKKRSFLYIDVSYQV